MSLPPKMFFATLLLPIFSSAFPLSRRNCATTYPTFLTVVVRANPDASTNPGWNRNSFTFKDDTIRTDTIFQFDIPPNSYDCQLELFFDQGSQSVYGYKDGPLKANVYTLDTPVSYNVTWNSAPATGGLFGSTGEVPTAPESGYAGPFKRVINSATCKDVLTYRMEVPEEVEAGGLLFNQNSPGEWSREPYHGWRIAYNC